MRFYADLHVHSRYARATSKDLDLEHLAIWARKKGLTVVATGDFTHPAWRAELRDKLVPAEPGLFQLRPDIERAIAPLIPRACHRPVRFMLEVEVSTIYKKDDKTRKVHHLLYASSFDELDAIVQRLERIGNLAADGRPILGLDSRDLLEVVLESGPHTYLVPAHIWTPWFAALGSKSGFDSIAACYGDLTDHIFAVETGLSSDPPMNWRVSDLDRFRLVSNSDAHSPAKLAREANLFHTDLDYFAIRRALETGQGFGGTVEFFPEEGKYHMDGHRACKVRLSPEQTRAEDGRCPACGQPVTVGVMHRVERLADRPEGYTPDAPDPFRSLVPLPEVLGEVEQVGPGSKRVQSLYHTLLERLGPELDVLDDTVPIDAIRRHAAPIVADAIDLLRQGEVTREAGFDGQYGTIRVFGHDGARRPDRAPSLLGALGLGAPALPPRPKPARPPAAAAAPAAPTAPDPPEAAPQPDAPQDPLLGGLNPEQAEAARTIDGPLLVVAGPGTGKTRTLVHRLAHMVRSGVPPERCLAISFTRRAADELRARLNATLPDAADRILATTFHGLGLELLREDGQRVGLHRGFTVAEPAASAAALAEALACPPREAARLLQRISHLKRLDARPDPTQDPALARAWEIHAQRLDLLGAVDFDDLIRLPVRLLSDHPDVRARQQRRFGWIAIDEYQDIDPLQYALVRLLVSDPAHVCAIGDPDQAIYGFRGADVGFFLRFQHDFPQARAVRLTRNYRSSPAVVHAALAAIAPDTSVAARALSPTRPPGPPLVLHVAPTERAEAEFVVKTLERLLGGHTSLSHASNRATGHEDAALSFADVAVLYRTDAQADALVEALHRSGLPFQRRSHRPLLEAPGVGALLEALRALDPAAPSQALVDRLDRATARLGSPDARRACDLLRPRARAFDGDLDAFVASLALDTQLDAADPRAQRIALLTLHAAKGLEWPVVFITGCEDGVLPLRWSGDQDDDPDLAAATLAEERRLFFVGLTRARDRLYLTRARKRRWRGPVRPMDPSPFLADLPAALTTPSDDAWTAAPKPDPDPAPPRQMTLW